MMDWLHYFGFEVRLFIHLMVDRKQREEGTSDQV
jgi:hypothetical protein